MKVSILIPCYNERSTIAAILHRIRAVSLDHELEIVVVDDASTDGTRELLQGELRPLLQQLILHESNQGKGAALSSGLRSISGDAVIIQDADLEYDPQDYPRLLEPFERGLADVVYGSRFISGSAHRVLYFWHSVANRALTGLENSLTGQNLGVWHSGLRAYSREFL